MNSVNIRLLLSYLAVGLFLSGCTEIRKYYVGPELPESEVAILKIRKETHIKKLMIDEIYRMENIPNKNVLCAILPGKHEVSWTGRHPGTNFDYKGVGTLNAKAGKQYTITIQLNYDRPVKQSGGWSTYDVESYETLIKEYRPLRFPSGINGYYKTEDFTPH